MTNFTENRKVRFDYQILETLEAGIVLSGQEVKSVKEGKASLIGAYVLTRSNRAELINATIPPYQPKNAPKDYNPTRPRQLLLHKDQLNHLLGKSKEGGLTIVPLSLYNKNRRIKVAIGLAKYKKKQDKRELLKKRQTKKEIQRSLKA